MSAVNDKCLSICACECMQSPLVGLGGSVWCEAYTGHVVCQQQVHDIIIISLVAVHFDLLIGCLLFCS